MPKPYVETVNNMTLKDRIIEEAAAIEHARWAKWQSHVQNNICKRNENGELVIPKEAEERWSRQITTLYSELSEEDKEKDRKQWRDFLSQKIQEVCEIMVVEDKDCFCKNDPQKIHNCCLHDIKAGYRNARNAQIIKKREILGE